MSQSTLFIAISGGSGSGKTTFARRLAEALQTNKAQIIAQDHYYRDQSDKFDHDGGAVNFDHPSSIDFPLFIEHLHQLQSGKAIQIPRYDFKTHSRLPETGRLEAGDIVILDGTLILAQEEIRPLLYKSIFIDTAESLRFERRLHRDTKERGREVDGVYAQFFTQVKPMHDQFVEPSKKFADIQIGDLESFDLTLQNLTLELDALVSSIRLRKAV